MPSCSRSRKAALRNAEEHDLFDLVPRREVGRRIRCDLLRHVNRRVDVVAEQQAGAQRSDFRSLHPALDVRVAAGIDELPYHLLEHVTVGLIDVLGELLRRRFDRSVAASHPDHAHRGQQERLQLGVRLVHRPDEVLAAVVRQVTPTDERKVDRTVAREERVPRDDRRRVAPCLCLEGRPKAPSE